MVAVAVLRMRKGVPPLFPQRGLERGFLVFPSLHLKHPMTRAYARTYGDGPTSKRERGVCYSNAVANKLKVKGAAGMPILAKVVNRILFR